MWHHRDITSFHHVLIVGIPVLVQFNVFYLIFQIPNEDVLPATPVNPFRFEHVPMFQNVTYHSKTLLRFVDPGNFK